MFRMPIDRYNIVHVRRDFINEVQNAFMSHWDVARLLQLSFQSLGIPATVSINQLSFGAINIVIGYERLPANALPPGTRYIPYQLEQLPEGGHSHHPEMFNVLRNALAVWEYSPVNVPILERHGVDPSRIKLLPMGFHEGLATIQSQTEDIDVLFYGSQNPRRERIINELRERCAMVNLFGIYGEQRDAWIARSKVILNMHYYDAGLAELPRITYLLNNRKCVVSEQSRGDPFASLCRTVPYEGLVEACLELAKNPPAREALKAHAWEQFSRQPMTANLEKIL
jgi:hypothetical protein